MKVVSERFISWASPCICLSVKSRASVKTANGLPASGVWGKNIKLNEIVAGSHVRKYLFV